MGLIAILAGVMMAQSVSAQPFTAYVSYYDVEGGSTLTLDGDHWEFRIKGRKGFMRMLYEIHDFSGYVYDVRWGDPDVLRIEVQPRPATNGVSAFDMTLRQVLNAVAMTYRMDGGLYNICAKPIPLPQDYGLIGPDESHFGRKSLDALALRLSELGIGYRVEGARGAIVGLKAPFVSLSTLAWIVQELDPVLHIDTRHGVVVRRQFYFR